MTVGGWSPRRWGEKTEGGWKEYNEEFVKRCFGETVRAAGPEGMVREVKRKFRLYSLTTRI